MAAPPRDFGEDYCKHPKQACFPFERWRADPDIAGRGVIIAFGATSVITLLVIIVGYFLDAIRDEEEDGLLNDLDHRIVRGVSNFCKRTTRVSVPIPGSKRGRRDALERFVLVLSDQQIVTGLAISIIGFAKHCTMSSYHFFVIVALVWFSSTTHLSTLSLLQNYLRTHTRLRYTRLVGMFALYVMLMVGMVVLYTTESFRVPVQCRLKRLSLDGTPPRNYATAIALFAYLTVAYFSRLAKLSLPPNKTKMQTSHKRRQYYGDRISHASYTGPSSFLGGFQRAFATFTFTFLEFLDSFLWQIIWLFFGNFYGIRQLYWVQHWVRDSIILPEGQGNENEFGSGQLLALLLLALPVLAAIEAFSDVRKDEEHDKPQRLQTGVTAQNISENPDRPAAPERAESRTHLLAGQSHSYVPLQESSVASEELTASVPGTFAIFGCLFAYTLSTLIVVAWYVAYTINEKTAAGVDAGLIMSGALLLVAVLTYLDDLRRPEGLTDNAWVRLGLTIKQWRPGSRLFSC